MPFTNSPLRYPGGKSQLSNYVKHILQINDINGTYIEPFAGGFGVGLDLLFSEKVKRVVINDLDPSIFAIWYAILNNTDDFVEKIIETPITINEWEKQRKIRINYKNNPYSLKNAFSSFFLNRTNVSGIINGGPIGGKGQSGKYKINCRFNKKKIIEKIYRIKKYNDRIILKNINASEFVELELPHYSASNTFIFFDPPYYFQGKNLYLSSMNENEHLIMAKSILSLDQYYWITTYDISDYILSLYYPHVPTYKYSLNYSANKKRKAEEYLFAANNLKITSYANVDLKRII